MPASSSHATHGSVPRNELSAYVSPSAAWKQRCTECVEPLHACSEPQGLLNRSQSSGALDFGPLVPAGEAAPPAAGLCHVRAALAPVLVLALHRAIFGAAAGGAPHQLTAGRKCEGRSGGSAQGHGIGSAIRDPGCVRRP